MNKKILLSAIACAMFFSTNSFAFSDVDEDFWAHDAISFMEQRKIVNGFLEDGTFRPSEFATREQTAAILRNFFDIELKNKVKEFSDVDNNSWSKEHIDLSSQYLYDNNSTSFRPYDLTTRIEVAEAVIRILGLDLDKPNLEIIENFNDYNTFSENDKVTISLAVENGIMKGYDDGTFLPNGNITRAEICSLLYNTFNEGTKFSEKNNDKVVISVDDKEITVKDFNLYFNLQKRIYEMLFGSRDIWTKEVQDTVLYSFCKDITKDEIIKIKLNLKKAEEMGIEIDEETKKKFEEQVKSEDSKKVCEYYGITSEDMLKILEESEINELVAKSVYNTIDHSNHEHADINELKDEFSYDIRHILILTQNKTEEEIAEAKKKAESIFVRVNNGEDFAKLANEYSEDAGSNKNGGLYENVKLGNFVKEIEEVAVNGEVGKIYQGLVKTVYGYHVVKVEGKRTEKVEMEDSEKMEIINADFDEILSNWVKEANVIVDEEVYNRI